MFLETRNETAEVSSDSVLTHRWLYRLQGDGSCLLHATSLFVTGLHDRAGLMRAAVPTPAACGPTLNVMCH